MSVICVSVIGGSAFSRASSSAAVWDVHYVANADTLYAAGTNGEVQVYEDFKDSMGQAGPDRTIIVSDGGIKVGVNLHGVTVDSNTLYLSDVGDAMNTTDGQLFVLNGADTLTGNVPVTQRIAGGSLGNPVDLEVVQQGMAGAQQKHGGEHIPLRFQQRIGAIVKSFADNRIAGAEQGHGQNQPHAPAANSVVHRVNRARQVQGSVNH